MSETQQLNEKYTNFLDESKALKSTLDQLKKFENIENLSEKLSLVDYAQLNAALAYALNSLYYMYMKNNGLSMEDHKINTEMDRIKGYFTKIQEVILAESDAEKNPLSINTEAAERMIKSHLQENFTKEEKDKLEGDEVIEDIWKGEENKGSAIIEEKAPSANKMIPEVAESDSDSDSILQETNTNTQVKKSKKLNKGSLLPSGTHLNWKDQIEKMLQ